MKNLHSFMNNTLRGFITYRDSEKNIKPLKLVFRSFSKEHEEYLHIFNLQNSCKNPTFFPFFLGS